MRPTSLINKTIVQDGPENADNDIQDIWRPPTGWTLKISIKPTDVTPEIFYTRDFVARLYRAIKSQHATVQLHAATLSRTQTKQT